MYLIKLACGTAPKTTLLFDETSEAEKWFSNVENRLIDEGIETVRPSTCLPGRRGLAARIHDRVVVATGQPVDEAVLKEHVKAPDWCIKLLLQLSPN